MSDFNIGDIGGIITGKSGKSYEVQTRCKNCKLKQTTKILKGHMAKDVISKGKCEECGCQTLELVKK